MDDEFSPERVMLLSIRPRHVEGILAGTKTTELRRTRPRVVSGQPVMIYSTSPVCAVVATCRIAGVTTAGPAELWAAVCGTAAVTRDEFDVYFAGRDGGTALRLQDITVLPVPVTLKQMRAASAFHPPQTWHFLDPDRLLGLLGDHPSSVDVRSFMSGVPATLRAPQVLRRPPVPRLLVAPRRLAAVAAALARQLL